MSKRSHCVDFNGAQKRNFRYCFFFGRSYNANEKWRKKAGKEKKNIDICACEKVLEFNGKSTGGMGWGGGWKTCVIPARRKNMELVTQTFTWNIPFSPVVLPFCFSFLCCSFLFSFFCFSNCVKIDSRQKQVLRCRKTDSHRIEFPTFDRIFFFSLSLFFFFFYFFLPFSPLSSVFVLALIFFTIFLAPREREKNSFSHVADFFLLF